MTALDTISRNRLIDRKELRRLVLYSDSQIYRMEKDETFPKRIRLGPGRVAWSLRDVLAWIDCRKDGRIWTAESPTSSGTATHA